MRILICAAALACFGAASAQTASSGQKTSPAVRVAPLATKSNAVDPQLAANRKELAEITAQLDSLKRKKDSIGELGANDQAMMHAAMERKSKVEQRISELMKKSSDTQSGVVSNIK